LLFVSFNAFKHLCHLSPRTDKFDLQLVNLFLHSVNVDFFLFLKGVKGGERNRFIFSS
jgi:hypothetical protein